MTSPSETMPATLDRRALGRRLSALANASVADVLGFAAHQTARGLPRIGLTGAPGVGKSSLGARLAVLRSQRLRVGMLAVDPSSPISGGAILGDRIRLDELAVPPELYMRSLASRTAADGLADNLPELLEAMEAAGFDELVVETVGVGQAEHAVRSQVDTLALVLMPGSGDVVQAMKAGTMELADLYVINKCELPGAAQLAGELRRVQQLNVCPPDGWTPPVLLTSIHDPDSIEALSRAIDDHRHWLTTSQQAGIVRREQARYRLKVLLERRIAETLATLGDEFWSEPLLDQFNHALARLALDPPGTGE